MALCTQVPTVVETVDPLCRPALYTYIIVTHFHQESFLVGCILLTTEICLLVAERRLEECRHFLLLVEGWIQLHRQTRRRWMPTKKSRIMI